MYGQKSSEGFSLQVPYCYSSPTLVKPPHYCKLYICPPLLKTDPGPAFAYQYHTSPWVTLCAAFTNARKMSDASVSSESKLQQIILMLDYGAIIPQLKPFNPQVGCHCQPKRFKCCKMEKQSAIGSKTPKSK